jgi:hypothetical protein
MKTINIPTMIKKTPILLRMQAIINEMGETSNDRFSHSKCDTDPGFPGSFDISAIFSGTRCYIKPFIS